MEVDCRAALFVPSTATDRAKVARATEGAAPNNPAKLLGLKRSPSKAKVETDTPPIKKRSSISFTTRAERPRELQQVVLVVAYVALSQWPFRPVLSHLTCRVWIECSAERVANIAEYSEDRIIQSGAQSYKSKMKSNRQPHNDRENLESSDERSPELKGDLEAQPDELGDDPAQVGVDSAGQSVSSQGLSETRESDEESVEELSDADQAIEAASVEGVEDAADHPERPTHTHEEYGNPEDVPPRKRDEAA